MIRGPRHENIRLLRLRTHPFSSIPTSAAVITTIDQDIVMLIHPTVERLRALGLTAMADTLIEPQNNPQAAEMPHGTRGGRSRPRQSHVSA